MESSAQENNNVCILVGIWGEKFINDFLQLSFPSLLAPGNIPALANTYKTRFVFLTRSYDVPVFEDHPAFQKLRSLCEIEFIPINDLIVIGNYSTTLTLAYDRAIRQTGEQMLNTYFVFLTSDYIMADGSLEGLMRYMKKGYSGICAGNFQVLQEDIEPILRGHIDAETQVMQIKPRELLKMSFPCLHPITITSIFENSMIHNYRANRFFLRHDSHTLAGRFYLLHMLCIKPETMDYQVGSSCDYSFIPEMCPSGNIAVINDSDDYLVIEIQSKEHEIDYVKWGAYDHKKLVHALAEWTTNQHRANAKHTIYYHTDDITPESKNIIEKKFDQFIDGLAIDLQKYKIQPYRDHPYWLGAVRAFDEHRSIIKGSRDCDYFDLSPLNYVSKWRKIFYRFFGNPPTVFRWHYRWREYHSVMDTLQQYITPENYHKTIALYDSYQFIFMRYSRWLKKTLKISHHYHAQNLIYSKALLKDLQTQQFELSILLVRVEDLNNVTKTIMAIKKILTPNGKILILVHNQKIFYPSVVYDFRREFAYKMNYIMNPYYRIAEITTIHDNLSFLGSMAIDVISKKFDYNKKLKFLSYFLVGLPGTIFCFARNCFSKVSNRKTGHCTDILVTLVPDEQTGNEA